jgi:hypothetical protein
VKVPGDVNVCVLYPLRVVIVPPVATGCSVLNIEDGLSVAAYVVKGVDEPVKIARMR